MTRLWFVLQPNFGLHLDEYLLTSIIDNAVQLQCWNELFGDNQLEVDIFFLCVELMSSILVR